MLLLLGVLVVSVQLIYRERLKQVEQQQAAGTGDSKEVNAHVTGVSTV